MITNDDGIQTCNTILSVSSIKYEGDPIEDRRKRDGAETYFEEQILNEPSREEAADAAATLPTPKNRKKREEEAPSIRTDINAQEIMEQLR